MPMNMKILNNNFNNIPMPSTINYNWNIGFLLSMTIISQMITGVLLSFHYSSTMEEAFSSVIKISRDVNNGWIIRIMHINMASLLFFLIYFHISKNMLNSSFKIKMTWNTGIMILLMLMMTAFMGYVLPWGQMSFWAATVITNLMSAIPIWGNTIVKWLWGGFSVDFPTLLRFFSLHFLLPMMILIMIMIHIISLHLTGSSNPISISMNKDKINFQPFFMIKDIMSMMSMMVLFMMMIMKNPFFSTDPENFIPANPMLTPIHIQPEWYFLFAYAILRSIPNKLGGVLALMMSIIILTFKTLQKSKKVSFKFKKMKMIMFSMLVHVFLILTWIGMKQIEEPFLLISKIYSLMHFMLIMMM